MSTEFPKKFEKFFRGAFYIAGAVRPTPSAGEGTAPGMVAFLYAALFREQCLDGIHVSHRHLITVLIGIFEHAHVFFKRTESMLRSQDDRIRRRTLLQKTDDELPAEIQQMVDERAQARKEKNWKRSDELRDAIKAAGYVLEDTPQGQKVRKSV